MVIKSYRDLVVWQKSMTLVKDVYKLSIHFPKEEQFVLVPQMRRSAISIPSNIAEGYGRNSRKEYKRFLSISRGSLFELQTQLEIASELNYISNKINYSEIINKTVEIDKILNTIIKKLD